MAKAKKESPSDVTVVILDRPRHDDIVEEVRATGARIKFITDGDVAGAIMAAREGTGIDLLLGIGGTPEGIIAACAMKMPRRRHPGPALAQGRRRAAEGARRGPRPRPGAARPTSWSAGDDVFFVATGITDGELLTGVRYRGGRVRTHSMVMRSRSGTIRIIESEHQLDKLRAYASIDFGSAN